jgi:stage II sporulation protein AA (anti-sigma F factor antagonist)
MSLGISRQGDVLVAVIEEPEIDYTNCGGIREQLLDAAREDGIGRVLLDLESVSFMDSKAIGALVAVHKEVQKRTGTPLVLCGLHPYVKKVISVVTLNTIFEVFENRKKALSAIQS